MTAAGTQQAAMVASVPETVPKIEMVGVPGKEVSVQAQVELPRQTQIKGQAQTQAAGQTPGQALVPGQVQTQVIEAVTVAEAQPFPLATETEQKISKHAEAMKRSPMPPVVALQVQEPSRTSATQPLDVAIEIGIAEQSRPIGASAESGLFSEQNSQEHTPSTPQQLGQVSAHPAKAVELPVAAAAQPLAQPVSQSVLEQVRDHLARREVTTNGNLVRLQLNPAELGELQITLHMDDKRLRVEILTENKAVKAALLDNMDSLKDILSRQHIAMERFDVGTGSNSGQFFREGTASEAQARPLPKFLNGNGNKLGAETGAVAAWQPRSNALVDVRF
jgi:flagellar hook-length control protein FliK